jgi:hypothetical protein
MNIHSYEIKYEKYKAKYLNLKKQIGGAIKFDTFSQPTTRSEILARYTNSKITIEKIECSSFGDIIINIMKFINRSYISRDHNGIYYPEDYVKFYNYDDKNYSQLYGLTNINFFESIINSNFMSRLFILPSDALNAFIRGPTFADCASVIQICIYKYIYDLVGKDKFDSLFGMTEKPTNQLIITQHLFDPLDTTVNTNAIYKSIHPKYPIGNPLYFLFDKIIDFDINKLEHGDIVHIKGVKQYSMKHLVGSAPGWNLICVKEKDLTKFIGFGPNSFQKPLTYEEVKQLLIDEYNKDQSNNTKERIRIFSERELPDNDSILVKLAITLETDKVLPDSEIGGLILGIRFNQEKFRSFLLDRNNSWTNPAINYDEHIKSLPTIEIRENKFLIPFTRETENKTFKNYIQNTQERKAIYDIAFKFAQSVSLMGQKGIEIKGPIGLLMSGTTGIGKSHLSVSIGKYVNQYGKKLLFVDETFISSEYQNLGTEKDYSKSFDGIDLIIFDDSNSSTFGSIFLKHALKYIFDNSKAIVISSNNDISSFALNLPYFINYNDPITHNFKYIRNINMESFRRPWTDTIIGKTLNDLFHFNGDTASAIIINEPTKQSENLKKYADELLKLYQPASSVVGVQQPASSVVGVQQPASSVSLVPLVGMLQSVSAFVASKSKPAVAKLPKIRFVKEPMKVQDKSWKTVYDLYVTDACEFDYCFINVYDDDDIEQLIKLVNLIHNCGKKIVVITNEISFLTTEINKYFKNKYQKENNPRLIERLKMIFPGLDIKKPEI